MAFAGPSLLFVDDDVASIKVMGRLLAQYGDQRFATSAQEALRQVRSCAPDLIVADADMPGMSGFDLCRELKRDPRLAQVPVIVATAHAGPDFEIQAFESGAVDFISKPLVPEQLRARVRAHLRSPEQPPLIDESAAVPAPAAVRQRPLLMVVDDDVVAMRTLESVLVPLGDLCTSSDGADALRQIRARVPDLVLLDAGMPGLNGFEVCAALKQDPLLRHVPVVFVTRLDDAAFEARALDLGAADFIAKPFQAAVVRARVRNILELKRRNEEVLAAAREHWRMVGDARVAEIVRGVGEGIVSVNHCGRIVLANPAACALLGRLDSQLVGQPFEQVFGVPVPAPGDGRRQTAAEVTLPEPSGRRVELSSSVTGRSDEALTTVLMRDQTQREQLSAEADRRLRAEERSRTLGLMMSYLAHEVGNPVAGIVGLSRMLVDAQAQRSPETEPARLVALLQSCAEQLRRVTQDFVDIGRLESGRFSVERHPISVQRCLAQAAAQLDAQAREAGVSLRVAEVDAELRAWCDEARFTQVLVNLLGNAVKYNRRGGSVGARVQRDAGRVWVEVADDGIGMSPEQVAQLFEPFNRLGREGGAVPGAGLGMALSRQLMLAMGGALEVHSRPGQGTTIRVELGAA